jgi:hypothetical protein
MGISGWLSDLCAAETDEPWAQEELAKAFFSGSQLSTALKAKAEMQSKSVGLLPSKGEAGLIKVTLYVFAWAHLELSKPVSIQAWHNFKEHILYHSITSQVKHWCIKTFTFFL